MRVIYPYLVVLSTLLCCATFFQATFDLVVYPDEMEALAQQDCVFLIKVEDSGEGAGEGEGVSLKAEPSDLPVWFTPSTIKPTEVGEVHVRPRAEHIGKQLELKILAERLDVKKTRTLHIKVIAGEDLLADHAAEIRDRFVAWLQVNKPEFNITTATLWQGTIVDPRIMIVSYYLFFSPEWEMGLWYHVMIPPNDWARIYLRRRGTEWQPSYAFEIASLDANDEPKPIVPPEHVIR